MYHKLTIKHKQSNLVSSWLIVLDDQNEESFSLWLESLGSEGLVQEEINCEL